MRPQSKNQMKKAILLLIRESAKSNSPLLQFRGHPDSPVSAQIPLLISIEYIPPCCGIDKFRKIVRRMLTKFSHTKYIEVSKQEECLGGFHHRRLLRLNLLQLENQR